MTDEILNISPKKSMKGWTFEQFIIKQIISFKIQISMVFGLFIYLITTNAPIWANALATILTLFLSLLIMSIIDFYYSEVKLK